MMDRSVPVITGLCLGTLLLFVCEVDVAASLMSHVEFSLAERFDDLPPPYLWELAVRQGWSVS